MHSPSQTLPPAVFHILVALADGEQHGYAIIQDVADRTNGEVRLSPGTLYRSLERMLEDGLIVELTRKSLPSSDGPPRRYYRATAEGIAAARAEVTRLNALVRLAAARGLRPAPAS